MDQKHPSFLNRIAAPFMEMFGLSRTVAVGTVLLVSAILALALFWFFHSAPPTEITISSGPPGSSLEHSAQRYREILATNGVTVHVLQSEGSLQNLERLQDPEFKVDVGFVQSGISNGPSQVKVVTLGSVSYQPLLIFYRGEPISLLSELKGKRLAVGHEGSGTRSLALVLLHLNGIDPGGSTVLEDIEAAEGAKALLSGAVDAVFLMGDSASPEVMRELLLAPGIRLLDFPQADAYVRKVGYLNKLDLPRGGIDLGKNIPAHDLSLIAPTVELLARPHLHPALCDLLIDAARQVHGSAGLLRRKNEFPALVEHEHPISTEASRYYKSGKSFLYRWLPFWLASLVNRVLLAFVPVVVLLIPAVKLLPTLLRLRVKLRIYRRYHALLAVERDLWSHPPEKTDHLLARLDGIEEQVNRMKVPASFADQFYTLRGSIGFVRQQVIEAGESKSK